MRILAKFVLLLRPVIHSAEASLVDQILKALLHITSPELAITNSIDEMEAAQKLFSTFLDEHEHETV
ncbi:hypothetical protein Ciccas_012551 [Cichlidogyrus casuarinus]|uniref:Uncharacterized protein n=1 Tax=Cichlidogyrus casuarinus TaxID=1844966 RepID=A0ABD2PN52_9PLAT